MSQNARTNKTKKKKTTKKIFKSMLNKVVSFNPKTANEEQKLQYVGRVNHLKRMQNSL